ncbi:hypothetical protein A4H97_26300 [Niastella yeongjuensis]|uniref:Uncharacterized protein n=2 Tax=Niastella yeongjuensis TaxID=354355 RepID=A0A1V9F0B8_9BACT|nr:hypothetical protein A4H97_26300 [Niastella yeongjuensis]
MTVLLPVVTIAQTQSPKISGIGRFKIGFTTTTIIDELSKEFSSSITETNDIMATMTNYYDENPTKILYISKEKNENAEFPHTYYLKHPKVKVYFLNNFLIPEVVVLHNIYLKFYNDTLYSLNCEGSELLDTALTLKYGNPKFTAKTKNIACSNAYRTFTYEEATYTKEWVNPSKKITADLVYSRYYNSKCEKQILNYFLLFNNVITKKIDSDIAQSEQLQNKQNLSEKKKSLSNF